MMLDDLLDCDKCELDLCSSLQLQGIGPQRAGEENWQSRTCCNAQTPPPFKARIGKIEAIYNLPIRTNANAYQYPVWRCIKVIQSDSNVFNVSESNFVTHAASFCTQKGTSIIHANHIVSLPKAGNFDRYWPDPSCKPLGTSTKSPMTKHNPTVQKYFQLQSSGHFGNASCGCPSGCICWSLDLTTPKRLLWQKWVHTPTDLAAPGNMHSWWLPRTKRLHLSFKISVPHQKHMSLNACLYIYIYLRTLLSTIWFAHNLPVPEDNRKLQLPALQPCLRGEMSVADRGSLPMPRIQTWHTVPAGPNDNPNQTLVYHLL